MSAQALVSNLPWLLTIILVLSIALVELFLRLPFTPFLSQALRASRQAFWVLRARSVGDYRKERVLLVYAGRLFSASLALVGLLGILALVATALLWSADQLLDGSAGLLLNPTGLVLSALAAALYATLRRFIGHHALR